MLKSLTLKQAPAFMAVLLLLADGGFIIASVYINAEVRTVKEAWTESQVVRSEKARLGGQLRAALGYGGVTHSFKNYVLRGQDEYLDRARGNISDIKAVIACYRNFDLSLGESNALDDMLRMLDG